MKQPLSTKTSVCGKITSHIEALAISSPTQDVHIKIDPKLIRKDPFVLQIV